MFSSLLTLIRCATSDLRREVDVNCAVLASQAASNYDFVPTFQDNLSVPSSGAKSLGYQSNIIYPTYIQR